MTFVFDSAAAGRFENGDTITFSLVYSGSGVP